MFNENGCHYILRSKTSENWCNILFGLPNSLKIVTTVRFSNYVYLNLGPYTWLQFLGLFLFLFFKNFILKFLGSFTINRS